MATATVPAAVPDPNEPTSTNPGSPSSGLFSTMLAPVEPARPATFNIPAPATPEGATDAPATGASSASYHQTGEGDSTTGKSGSTIDKRSVWRAWLLAGATRWAKGGGAANKRLDVAKTRAQRDAKEDRKVTVNRSEGTAGKAGSGTGSGGNSGAAKGNSGSGSKGPTKAPEKPVKNPPKEQPKSPRNSNGNAHQGPAGRSGGSGSPAGGGAGRGSTGGGSNSGTTPKNGKTDAGRDHKPKADLTKGSDKGRGTNASGKSGTGPAGSAGKPGASGGGSGSAKGTDAKGGAGKNTKSPEPKTGTGTGKDNAKGSKQDGKQGNGKVDLTKGKAPQNSKSGRGTEEADGKGGGKKAPDGTAEKGKSSKADEPKRETAKTGEKNGKPFSTKESRLTGYRDGTRAAKAVAHAKAYGDGVKDGYRDVTEAAERQKTELDKAHEERKKAQEAARDKETDVSGAGSSADHHKPVPIEVKGVDANTVWLGEGADRNSISRSEVRSLKTYERRLEAKETSMKKVAEGTKLLKAHAEAQAQKVTALMEATKTVKGGEKLIASLVKTADDAKIQAGEAEEIHKRAVRAADGCAAVLANAKTRYGGMHKAVIDSDEDVPGEMSFYRDGAETNA
ncbi:hypothetical protein [Streptomyces decoyicus]|uniref:hypothetical protein n=1 Tax=Streptomyces decoyicus TaxID=249567 RepID=UPI002F9199FD